jgi:CBS-domain-containing membrane protein
VKTAVKDVMTTCVMWVRQDLSFKQLAAALRDHQVSAFPVLDDQDKVIGVISEADLLAKEALDSEPGFITGILHHRDAGKAHGVIAGDLMTSPAVTVAPEDTVEHAARLMYTHKVKRLPVTDAHGYLVGIVSRGDVLSVFSRPDRGIRDEIKTNVLLNDFLVDPAGFKVTVKDGVVTLTGTPETGEVGREIVRQVRHVQGVVAVRDRLDYPAAGRPGPARAFFPMD